MLIVTPTAKFPDTEVLKAAQDLGFNLAKDTLGLPGVIQEQVFTSGNGQVRYMREPELEIPVIVIDGPNAEEMRSALADKIKHITAFAATIGYDPTASETVRITTLRMISAHALEEVSEPIVRVAALAVLDPSPYVRLGVVQLLQYAHEATIADIVRHRLLDDDDPDVRSFAKSILARFDAAPKEMGSDD